MSQQEIYDANKLIAEFMGGKLKKGYFGNYGYDLPKKIKTYRNCGKDWWCITALDYNISWDWLMPVLQKIHNGIIEESIELDADGNYLWTLIEESIKLFNIKAAHYNTVKFINWYNKFKNKINR